MLSCCVLTITISWLISHGEASVKNEFIDDQLLHSYPQLGIALEKHGFLLDETNEAFASVFLKIPNPAKDYSKCRAGCVQSKTELHAWARRCKASTDVTFLNEQNKITQFTIDDKVYQNSMERLGICLLNCLRFSNCKSFETRKNGRTCILRNATISATKSSSGSMLYDLHCLGEDRETVCESFLANDELNNILQTQNEEFVNNSWNEYTSLLIDSNHTRRRRSAELAIPVLSSLAVGLSVYESFRLSSHVKKLDKDFHKFKSEQIQFNKEVIRFEENILKIYRGLEREEQAALTRIECKISSVAFGIMNNQRLMRWKSYLENIWRDLLRGEGSGSLSPIIFKKQNLEKLLQNSPQLIDTIYHHDLNLIYRLSKMIVVSAHREGQDHFNVHVVLKVPIIKVASLRPVYRVLHVGLRFGDNCVRLKLPKLAVEHNDTYYSLQNPTCQDRRGLQICRQQLNNEQNLLPCVSSDTTCEPELVECKDNIIQTFSGVLVFTDKKIKASRVDNINFFVNQETNEHGVAYFPYSDFYNLLIGNELIPGLQTPAATFNISFGDPEKWLTKLHNQSIDLGKQNISSLSSIVHGHQKIVNEMQKLPRKIVRKYLYWVPYLTLVIIILAPVIYFTRNYIKIRCLDCLSSAFRYRSIQHNRMSSSASNSPTTSEDGRSYTRDKTTEGTVTFGRPSRPSYIRTPTVGKHMNSEQEQQQDIPMDTIPKPTFSQQPQNRIPRPTFSQPPSDELFYTPMSKVNADRDLDSPTPNVEIPNTLEDFFTPLHQSRRIRKRNSTWEEDINSPEKRSRSSQEDTDSIYTLEEARRRLNLALPRHDSF